MQGTCSESAKLNFVSPTIRPRVPKLIKIIFDRECYDIMSHVSSGVSRYFFHWVQVHYQK